MATTKEQVVAEISKIGDAVRTVNGTNATLTLGGMAEAVGTMKSASTYTTDVAAAKADGKSEAYGEILGGTY